MHSRSPPTSICWRCLYTHKSLRTSPPRPSILRLKQPPRSYQYCAAAPAPVDLTRIRNIGIIAHIDAGKTTTTERMLYYSGFIRRIGEVDDGSTVMDYLPAERARGITITSAAITFTWASPGKPAHTINLIDTPGHADFTFEVERAIRVLDGAVTILDGVAGVEAQTEKVWRQAAKFEIPRLIFVNKLDRVGAQFNTTVREVATKLNGWPAMLQLPVYENDGKGGDEVLRGVVDIVEKRVYMYELGGDGQKIDLHDYQWLETTHPHLYAEALDARIALVELLSSHDDVLVEEFLEIEDHSLIPAASLKRSLRTITLSGSGNIIPILCGASFRNIGVQPLLDAIVDYLPSPQDRPAVAITHGARSENRAVLDPSTGKVCALAFKVINDPKRGAMVFVRVYSGTLNRAHNLFNTNLGVKERAHRLLQMYADEAVDIAAIPAGHIGVIIGLKSARTGDTLVADTPTPKSKKSKGPPAQIDHKTLQLRPIDVPPPVFFASLEPYSLSDQKPLEEALTKLLREDPSLHTNIDPDSGQTLLSGMGELHLEIARDRLVQDLKARADMGRILIAYRESITSASSPVTETSSQADGTEATVTATVSPSADPSAVQLDGNSITIAAPELDEDPTPSLLNGASAALSRGPHAFLPLHDVHIILTLSPPTAPTSPTALSTAARSAVAKALQLPSTPPVFIEPVMRVIVSCDELSLGKVVNDISSARGGTVLSLDTSTDSDISGELNITKIWIPGKATHGQEPTKSKGGKRDITARIPLRECVGYLKHLRSVTQGRGTFVMELDGWERVTGQRVAAVERECR